MGVEKTLYCKDESKGGKLEKGLDPNPKSKAPLIDVWRNIH